jgi:flagellar hook-associated protein 2
LATQGSAVGSAAANTTITAGVNDVLSLTVNGIVSTVTLAAGTYTAASLAAAVQSTINGNSALSTAGITTAVTQTAGVLTITSFNYGSSSTVAILGGNGAADLMGAAPVQTAGVDVAGTIGGMAATGSGQSLTASLGAPQGLKVTVTGGALGARGTLNYSQGYAASLSLWATASLANDGILTSHTNGIGKTITDISTRRSQMESRLVGVEARYRKQFTSLDAMLSSMNQTSTYLTQQLANLPKPY